MGRLWRAVTVQAVVVQLFDGRREDDDIVQAYQLKLLPDRSQCHIHRELERSRCFLQT